LTFKPEGNIIFSLRNKQIQGGFLSKEMEIMGNWKKQFKVGPRYVGKVKSFQKGWGVIITPGYGDLFVHWRALQVEGFKTLDEGDEVEFSVVNDSRGIRADKVIKTRSKALPIVLLNCQTADPENHASLLLY
jgi:CspA family cold shock protein